MQRGEVTPGSPGGLPNHPLHAVPAREEDRSGHRACAFAALYTSLLVLNRARTTRAVRAYALPKSPRRTASLCTRGDRRRLGLDLAAPTVRERECAACGAVRKSRFGPINGSYVETFRICVRLDAHSSFFEVNRLYASLLRAG